MLPPGGRSWLHRYPRNRREGLAAAQAVRGSAHNGTATGDSGPNPVALPPTVAPMWADYQRMFL
jgi:hypothetical protein